MTKFQDKNRFRAWDSVAKKWLQDFRITQDGKVIVLEEIDGQKKARINENAILCQCTGLTDNRGNPIFEGDIGEFEVRNEFGSWEKVYATMRWVPSKGGYSFELSRPYRLDNVNEVLGINIVSNEREAPNFIKIHDPITYQNTATSTQV